MSSEGSTNAKIFLSSPIKGQTPAPFKSLFNKNQWYETSREEKQLPIRACMNGIILESKDQTLVLFNSEMKAKVTYKNLHTQFYDTGARIQQDQVIALTSPERSVIIYVQDTGTEAFLEAFFTP